MSTDPLDELIENEILESQLYNILHDHRNDGYTYKAGQNSTGLPLVEPCSTATLTFGQLGDRDTDLRSATVNLLKRPSNSLCDEDGLPRGDHNITKIKESKRSNKRPRSKSILIPHTSHVLPSEEEQSATIKSHSCPLH